MKSRLATEREGSGGNLDAGTVGEHQVTALVSTIASCWAASAMARMRYWFQNTSQAGAISVLVKQVGCGRAVVRGCAALALYLMKDKADALVATGGLRTLSCQASIGTPKKRTFPTPSIMAFCPSRRCKQALLNPVDRARTGIPGFPEAAATTHYNLAPTLKLMLLRSIIILLLKSVPFSVFLILGIVTHPPSLSLRKDVNKPPDIRRRILHILGIHALP